MVKIIISSFRLSVFLIPLFIYTTNTIAAERSRCLEVYNWHIRAASNSDLQRLKPGTYTSEQYRESRGMGSGVRALSVANGALVELTLSPLTILASPLILRGHYKIKRLKFVRDLLHEVFTDVEDHQGSKIDYFLNKIRRSHRYSRNRNIRTRMTNIDRDLFIHSIRFADYHRLLCKPFDMSIPDLLFRRDLRDQDLFFVPMFSEPLDSLKFVKKFPIYFEAYLHNLVNDLRSEGSRALAFSDNENDEEEDNEDIVFAEKICCSDLEEGEECPICLEEFSQDSKRSVVGFPCDQKSNGKKIYHNFHKDCIKQVFSSSSHKCPLCRKKISF